MTPTDELLPCPICGGQPDFQHFNITPNVRGRIICTCGIELRQGKNDTEDDVRIIWNTRSDYAVQAANERKVAQAVAATVGRGTCEADETETIKCWVKCKDEPSTEHMELIHVMECSECGHTYEHVNGDYEFCPRCGRKRVDA